MKLTFLIETGLGDSVASVGETVEVASTFYARNFIAEGRAVPFEEPAPEAPKGLTSVNLDPKAEKLTGKKEEK
jgi:hypothetical protein